MIDPLESDAQHILVAHNHRKAETFDVYRINVHTGASICVAENPGNIASWHTNHAGQLRAAVTHDGLNRTQLYRDTEKEPFRPLVTTDFKTKLIPVLFSFDDTQIYVLYNRSRDTLALVAIDPARPADERKIFDAGTVDLATV